MSLASRLAVPLLALAPLIAVSPARADPAADAAAALQAQIRAWITGLAGPAIDLGSHAVQVTPVGDAYGFVLPLAGPVGKTGWVITSDPVTAIAKPLSGGAWSIESLHMPTPLRTDQQPMQNGKPANWVLKLADQEVHGRFDPTLATSSSFYAVLRDYGSVTQTAAGTQSTHIDRYTWHGGWQPTDDGRVTLSSEGQLDNLTLAADVPGVPGKFTLKAAVARSSGRVERLGFDQLGVVVRSITGLLPTVMQTAGGAPPGALAPADQARLHNMVVALSALLGGLQQETTLENVQFDVGGQGGSLSSLAIGFSSAAADGMMDASLRLAVEGIDSPLIPKGPLRDYLPRRITLTPTLSGIPADDLMALLLRAIDMGDKTDSDALQAEALGLLAKGPLTAGLDDVALNLGAAVLKANGAVTIAAVDDIKGTARIDVIGLDTLIRSANTVPELRAAAPFLILLKGIGEQKGTVTSWNITYADGKTEVNGTDLAALVPSSGK